MRTDATLTSDSPTNPFVNVRIFFLKNYPRCKSRDGIHIVNNGKLPLYMALLPEQTALITRYQFSLMLTFPQQAETIGEAIIFCGVHFLLDQKFDDLFSHHPLLHGHIRHILPSTTFLSHLRGCISPNSAPFCLIPTKMPRNLFRCLGGAFGYAYGNDISQSTADQSFIYLFNNTKYKTAK